jgi:hypothetical protein
MDVVLGLYGFVYNEYVTYIHVCTGRKEEKDQSGGIKVLFRRRDIILVMGMCQMMNDDKWMDGWMDGWMHSDFPPD